MAATPPELRALNVAHEANMELGDAVAELAKEVARTHDSMDDLKAEFADVKHEVKGLRDDFRAVAGGLDKMAALEKRRLDEEREHRAKELQENKRHNEELEQAEYRKAEAALARAKAKKERNDRLWRNVWIPMIPIAVYALTEIVERIVGLF